jgi:hypothetical protein
MFIFKPTLKLRCIDFSDDTMKKYLEQLSNCIDFNNNITHNNMVS